MTVKSKIFIDYIFLVILAIFIGIAVYSHFVDHFFLYFSNYLAFFAWSLITFYKILRPKGGSYFIFWLLLLGVFEITNFNIGTSAINYKQGSGNVISIHFDVLLFPVFFIYGILRRDVVLNIIVVIFHGTELEKSEKGDKMAAFYYEKFSSMTQTEFDAAFKIFESYPREAQIALNKIKSERGL